MTIVNHFDESGVGQIGQLQICLYSAVVQHFLSSRQSVKLTRLDWLFGFRVRQSCVSSAQPWKEMYYFTEEKCVCREENWNENLGCCIFWE